MAHAHPSLYSYSYSTVPAPLLLKSNAQVHGSPSRTAELGQHVMPSSDVRGSGSYQYQARCCKVHQRARKGRSRRSLGYSCAGAPAPEHGASKPPRLDDYCLRWRRATVSHSPMRGTTTGQRRGGRWKRTWSREARKSRIVFNINQ
jgi:hypothetical protein